MVVRLAVESMDMTAFLPLVQGSVLPLSTTAIDAHDLSSRERNLFILPAGRLSKPDIKYPSGRS
jgi:flagellar motor switch protein FliM